MTSFERAGSNGVTCGRGTTVGAGEVGRTSQDAERKQVSKGTHLLEGAGPRLAMMWKKAEVRTGLVRPSGGMKAGGKGTHSQIEKTSPVKTRKERKLPRGSH